MVEREPAPVPLLRVEEISKSFPGVLALKDVSLEVHPGEVLGLVGENGAGKSTLMKILSGVYAPDDGQILLDGLAGQHPRSRATPSASASRSSTRNST